MNGLFFIVRILAITDTPFAPGTTWTLDESTRWGKNPGTGNNYGERPSQFSCALTKSTHTKKAKQTEKPMTAICLPLNVAQKPRLVAPGLTGLTL